MWPPWSTCQRGSVLSLRNFSLIFFWSGKRDLVARKVLIHPKESGGFSVVSIDFKVAALLIQWVHRLVICPDGWVYLLTYWLLDRHGVPPFSLTPLLFPKLRSLLFTPIFFRPAVLSRVEPLLRASPLALWAAMPARSIPSPGSQLTPSSLALTRLPPTASPSFSHLLAAWNGLLLDKPSSCSLWTGVCRTSVG